MTYSKSEIKRLAKAGAIEVNGKKLTFYEVFNTKVKDGDVFKVGKRTWFKIKAFDELNQNS